MNILDLKKLTLSLEIEEELEDPRYLNTIHGTSMCYDRRGCRGPICIYGRAESRRKKEGGKPTMHPELLKITQDRYNECLLAKKQARIKETA